MARYRIYAAAIEGDGLQLSDAPRAYARTLREALAAASCHAHHGPEGAAIITPRGRTIYTTDDYDRAYARIAEDAR